MEFDDTLADNHFKEAILVGGSDKTAVDADGDGAVRRGLLLPVVFRAFEKDRLLRPSTECWNSPSDPRGPIDAGNSALAVDELSDARQRLDLLVFPESKAARGDAPVRGYCGRLDHHQSGPADGGAAAQMDQMPVMGKAILGGIVAHRRHGDAVAERECFSTVRLLCSCSFGVTRVVAVFVFEKRKLIRHSRKR
jgi:hypothetical protein